MSGPSEWWCTAQHADYIDRDNKGKKKWAVACERHQKEEMAEREE